MTSLFDITTPTNSVILGPNRQGHAAFTVSNISGRPCRGRARITAQNPLSAEWLVITGEPERDFPIASTQQFAMTVNVPEKAPPGNYPFHLDMVGVENPDEDFSEGQVVTFIVAPGAEKKYPWWIIAVAVGVLIVVIFMVVTFLFPRDEIPNMNGMSMEKAQQALKSAGLKLGAISTEVSTEKSTLVDQVSRSIPPAGSKVRPGTSVDLVMSNGVVVPGETETPLPTLTTATSVALTQTDTSTAINTETLTPPPPDPAVIANYPLNHSLVDVTGHKNYLYAKTAPYYLKDGGIDCNGTYCDVESSISLPKDSPFSVAIRFMPRVVNQMPVFTVFFTGNRSQPGIGYYLLANGDIGLEYLTKQNNNNNNNSDAIENYADMGQAHQYKPGQWYFAMIRVEGSRASLYLNGQFLKYYDLSSVPPNHDLVVSIMNDKSNNLSFDGSVSNLMVYNQAEIPLISDPLSPGFPGYATYTPTP